MKTKKLWFTFIIIFVILIIALSAYKTTLKYIEKRQTINEIKVVSNITNYKENSEEIIKRYQKEYQNNDIVGILKLEGAGINTFLVQTDNNDYYLNHLINKEYNKTGSVFVDYRTNIDQDKQVNIYGHSSGSYDIPFNNLKKYLNKNFYEQNKVATIDTINGSYKYEIFSVKITSDEEHLNVKFNNKESYKKHLEKLKEDSLYETNINVSTNDDILVLQTCIFNNPKGSLLIINLRKVG